MCLAVVSMAAIVAEIPSPVEADRIWPVGQVIPVRVEAGHARMVVPTAAASDRVLVIVSSLSSEPGVYPVQMTSSAADHAEPPLLHEDRPSRTPQLLPRLTLKPPPPPTRSSPPERTFWLPVRDGDPASPRNHVALRATLRAQGERVAVYVDPEDVGRVQSRTLDDLVATFDQQVYPRALAEIGEARDIDGDGRIAILLSGWLGHLADGRLAVDGFVRGSDFETSQTLPFGNGGDVIYLNAAMESGPHLRTVLAHEYTHAVTFCQKALGAASHDEEAWLDEAIAHLAEDLHGFSRTNLDYRVNAFLAAPERYRLIVDDYGTPDLIRSHGHRGSTYRFLRWCADQYGPRLLGTLARSPLRGIANLETATGSSFASLYRRWTVSLADNLLAVEPMRDRGSLRAPHVSRIELGHADSFVLDGTTTHFAIVDGSTTGAVAIRVDGPSHAAIQVTAIRLPDDLPRVDLSVALEDADHGGTAMRVRIRGRDALEVHLESLRWFPARPSSDASHREALSGQLVDAALREAMGCDVLAGRDFLTSRPIAIPRSDQPLTVVLTGRDGAGRRVVSWAEVGSSRLASD